MTDAERECRNEAARDWTPDDAMRERVASIQDAYEAGVIDRETAIELGELALDHDVYCYTGHMGDRWYVWRGDLEDGNTGYMGLRLTLGDVPAKRA